MILKSKKKKAMELGMTQKISVSFKWKLRKRLMALVLYLLSFRDLSSQSSFL
jgi:hypothetical protein